MRNTPKFIGFAVIVAIALTALAFTACDQPNDPGNNPGNNPNNPSGTSGKLTVNNLPNGGTYAVYVFANGTDISTFTAITNAYGSGSYQAVGASPSGNIFDLVGWNGTTATTTWTGSGSLPVLLLNASGNTTGTANPMYSWATISFTSGNGTANFSSFTAIEGGGIIGPGSGGKLEILNFPAGGSLAITIYDYDEEIISMTELAGVQADLSKLAAVSYGLAASSPVNLIKGGGLSGGFTGTGTYLVLLTNGVIPYYAEQVEFTNGNGTIDFSLLGLVSDLPLTAGGSGEPISDVNAIGAYLASQKGGTTVDKAINLVMNLALSEDNWAAILEAIGTADKFVNLDLSSCIGSGSGGGLRSDGTFDPVRDSYSNGKYKIVSLTLPNTTTKIAASDWDYYSSFRFFSNLKSVSGVYVIEIGNNAFIGFGYSYGSNIQPSVNFPLVKVIGDNAFKSSYLTSITIPNSVTSIGSGAFSGCNNLTAITVDTANTAYSSDNGVLYNNSKTTLIQYPAGKTGTSFTIPGSVINIGADAFRGCSDLINVTIPDSVISIEGGAFSGCANLTGVTIGNNVTTIGQGSFYNCTSLVSVIIPNSVTAINGDDGWNGKGAFEGCANLTSITIGKNVESIGNNVFSGCSNLTAINVDAFNTVYSSIDGVLYDKNKTTLVRYPAGKTASSFIIPNSVENIGYQAFYYCTNLTGVTIPNGVKIVMGWSFYGCSNLTNITIPNSVTEIGWLAFCYCYNLTSVTIGNGITSMGIQSFTSCTSLTSVTFTGTIPSSGFAGGRYGSFLGDLCEKFYSTDATNGTAGTYTTTAPVGDSSVWTKQ